MEPNAEQRKKSVFRAVVREYVKTAEPVGSETLVDKYGIDASSATIRNDMVDLEGRGLLLQPHTSAGRIPTPKGYRFYVTEFAVFGDPLSDADRERIGRVVQGMRQDAENAVREFAREIADFTHETVFVSVNGRAFYITGMSNLFRKPEFKEPETLATASKAFDELDTLVSAMRGRIARDVEVLIGDDNPFGDSLASVITRIDASIGETILGVLGPTRMDYDTNMALARAIQELFSHI